MSNHNTLLIMLLAITVAIMAAGIRLEVAIGENTLAVTKGTQAYLKVELEKLK